MECNITDGEKEEKIKERDKFGLVEYLKAKSDLPFIGYDDESQMLLLKFPYKVGKKIYPIFCCASNGVVTFQIYNDHDKEKLFDYAIPEDEKTAEKIEEIVLKIAAIEAHRYSSNNKPSLEEDDKCGCFHCLKIFQPSEIKDWITSQKNECDKLGTAVCPYCGVDSIIGESSGYPVTELFLQKMKDRWF